MKLLDKALELAWLNPVQRPLPKLACVLTDGVQEFIGLNSRKTHPLQKRFGKTPECIHLHAEIDAIRQGARLDLSGFDMYVARVRRDGSTALAKPCEGCLGAIVSFNIRDVYWTE